MKYLSQIAQTYGTPTYVYDAVAMREQYKALAHALPNALIAYAVKSNTALAVVRLLARMGAGADIVSGGELSACLAAGVDPGRIVFSGVGKTEDDIKAALDAGILQFNVESAAELEDIGRIAQYMGTKAPVMLRFTPDVGGAAFDKTTTGRRGDKFGLLEEDLVPLYAQATQDTRLTVRGLSMHIGSQILSLDPFEAAFARLVAVVERLRGMNCFVPVLDLGGGLGISYESHQNPPSFEEYADLVTRLISPLGVEIIVEPGRSLVGAAGVLLARVVRVKDGASGRFVILDAGMHTLIRPALYGAHHRIEPLEPRPGSLTPCTVVGPICESSDIFARDYPLPPLESGDFVLIRDAGAHGACLASTYNAYPLPAEVLVDGEKTALIRARQSLDDLFARDQIPEWV